MKRPPALEKGMKVALLSTARAITIDELQVAIELFKSWGLEVVLGKTINAKENQYAGNDQLRTQDLQEMLDREDIRAIFFARGGYGTVRIIDRLNFSKFASKPKWLVGYSDLTVLHSHVQKQLGVQSMHAGMPINFATNSPGVLNSLRAALFGELPEYQVKVHELNRQGRASGILCGGNLSVLYSISGTPSEAAITGRILFLEDLDEYLYHIDRMMMNLRRAGKLDKLAGVIVGGMTEMKDNQVPFGKNAEEIIAEHLSEFDFPVCYNFPAGHQPENYPLLLGAEVVFSVNESGVSLDYI